MSLLQKQLKSAFQTASIRRSRDMAGYGINRGQLQTAVAAGLVERTGRGLYMLPDSDNVTEKHTLAEVGQRIPKGVFCLLTALRFHELTTQNPPEVWVTLPPSAWRPRSDTVKIRIVHFSGAALQEGIESHEIEGTTIKVYNPAKTVADCFKFRHKIGLDIAMEGLREAWKARRVTMDQLVHYARICRVSHVMRPYLETLT